MQASELKNYDMGLAIDASGSMARNDPHTGKTRWKAVQESTFAIASKMAEYDSDGIDVFTFANDVTTHRQTTPNKVDDVFGKLGPNGGTATHLAIREARRTWEATKAAGTEKKGYILGIVTDGEPNDRAAVEKEIIELSNSLSDDGEFGIVFVQVGDDAGATSYLKNLDDGLQSKGAKYDIVDTVTFAESEKRSLDDLLINAILD